MSALHCGLGWQEDLLPSLFVFRVEELNPQQ